MRETILSILNQTFYQFELLILDDGSSDNSADIIREFAVTDKRIKAYYNANAGKSIATNYLVNEATTNWCAFIDADDVMMPERLQKQFAFHQQIPGISASSCNCYYINEEGDSFGMQRYHGLTTVAQYQNTVKQNKFITCSYTGLMVAKKAFVEAGGLSTMYEPCEDFEFINRLAEKRFVLLVIPVVLMKYRIHPSAVTAKNPMLVLDTIVFVKHNIRLRRAGKIEISLEAFDKIQLQYSWLKKFNRVRFKYSMIFFRNAGFSILSKNYPSFLLKVTTSMILSPNYVFKKIWNHLRK